jgi:hypothetical protein
MNTTPSSKKKKLLAGYRITAKVAANKTEARKGTCAEWLSKCWKSPLQREADLGTFAKLRKADISFLIFVCPSLCWSAWNSSDATGRIFMKFDI